MLTSESVNDILKKTAKADTKGEMNYEFIKRGNCSVTE